MKFDLSLRGSPALLTLAIVLVAACKSKSTRDGQPPHPTVRDAAAIIDASTDWPELAGYPRVDPVRTVTIPLTKRDNPRFDVGGPVLAGELAIVSSSQFGFAAIDYRRGAIAWTKPAGGHVAPPLLRGTSIVLVGECAQFVQVPDGEALLGCLRVVTTTGSDEAYIAIRGEPREVEAFATEKGPQSLWDAGEKAVRWRRGEQAVTIDLSSGVAKPASAEPPPLAVTYKGRRWEVTQRAGRIVARGKQPWETEHEYTAILGVVWLPDLTPLLRVVNLGASAGTPEVHLIDMDATGSLRATVARPAPGVALLGHGVSAQGDAAIAMRIDRSLERDFVAGYAANAMLVYVHALPQRKRTEPVGVAVAEDAVVVFHDGEMLTILPALSAPPTAPGATTGAWKNPTP